MTRITKPKRRRNRGLSLIIALSLALLVSIAIAGIIQHTYAIHRLNERSLALERAAVTAEAGLHQLIHYFNQADDLDSAGDSTNSGLIDAFWDAFAVDPDDGGVGAAESVFGDVMVIIDDTHLTNLIVMNNASVIELKVTAPRSGAASGAALTFECTAEANTTHGAKIQRTAYMDVSFSSTPRVTSPAPIITSGPVVSNGKFNLFWGEVWSIGDIALKMNRQNDAGNPPYGWGASGDNNQNVDEWTKYRSAQGYITDGVGTIENLVDDSGVNDVGMWSDDLDKYGDALYQFEDDFIAAGDPTLTEQIDDVFEQFAELGNPDNGYEFWKNIAITRDSYYRVASDGNVYDYQNNLIFGSDDDARDYYAGLDDAYVAFFDTTDGNPPVQDGSESNWADIRFTGVPDERTEGVLYVAGDLYIGGFGNPDDMNILNPGEIEAGTAPEDAATAAAVFHDGIIFTYGNYDYQGNAKIYGSVVAQGGYECGGTANVYYNAALEDGEPAPLSTRANILAVSMPSGMN